MSKEVATNKRARRDYNITDTFEAGLVLRGTEVKSIREGKVSITESFARIERGECWLYGCDIQPWQTAGSFFQHEAKRPRKLLLHKNTQTRIHLSQDYPQILAPYQNSLSQLDCLNQ